MVVTHVANWFAGWGMILAAFVTGGGAGAVSPPCRNSGGGAVGGGRPDVTRSQTMKIGLLAMSGVRAHDPVLLKLGLTLPGFVERSKTVAQLPSLGLLYLAACTPPGHAVRYFEAA